MTQQNFAGPDLACVTEDVRRALDEDIQSGDVTAGLIAPNTTASATVLTREPAVLCGQAWFEQCFRSLDPGVTIEWLVADGQRAKADTILCNVRGKAHALLSGERCALNFLQTLSATATAAASYVDAVAGTSTIILDTRKTLPGLRLAQKYAVRCGGATNNRVGLFDAILIKENHIAAARSLTAATDTARRLHPGLMLEVEVENFAELDEALAAQVDRIMLDEFTLQDMRRAVQLVAGRVPLEASGGISLERVRAIADTGVDFISVGALTKHIRAIDLSMRVTVNP